MQTISKENAGKFVLADGFTWEVERTISAKGLTPADKDAPRIPGTNVKVKLIFDFSGLDIQRVFQALVLGSSSLTVQWQNRVRSDNAADMEKMHGTTQRVRVKEMLDTKTVRAKKTVSLAEALERTTEPTAEELAAMKALLEKFGG